MLHFHFYFAYFALVILSPFLFILSSLPHYLWYIFLENASLLGSLKSFPPNSSCDTMLCRMSWVLCAIIISQSTSVLKSFSDFFFFFFNKYWQCCFIFLLLFRDLKNVDIIFVVLGFTSLPNFLRLYFYFQCFFFKHSRGPFSWNVRFCSPQPFINWISMVSILL